MSDDGAELGINAEDAMKAVLGGEEPTHVVTTKELVARIKATTGPSDYSGTADWTAHLILDWLEADPTRAQAPTENVYERDEDGHLKATMVIIEKGWYDRMKDDGIDLASLGLSGFMWGWAVNAARTCLELEPVPNPAIMTI